MMNTVRKYCTVGDSATDIFQLFRASVNPSIRELSL